MADSVLPGGHHGRQERSQTFPAMRKHFRYAHESTNHGKHRQCYQRNGHLWRTFMQVQPLFLRAAEATEKSKEQQAEHVESRKPGGNQAYDVQKNIVLK